MPAMGHRAHWKQCSVKHVDFLSRRLSSTFRWNGRGIVCLPSRIPVFLKVKIKKKSRSGRKIGAVGDDKQLIFFTRPKVEWATWRGFKDRRTFWTRSLKSTEWVPLVWHSAKLQQWYIKLKNHIPINNNWILVMAEIRPANVWWCQF